MYRENDVKYYTCPKYNHKLAISGKYYFFDVKNPYIERFLSSTCPLSEYKDFQYTTPRYFITPGICEFKTLCATKLNLKAR